MSTTSDYHLYIALVLLCIWDGTATAETRQFTLNQPDSRNLGVWRLTHDPVIRDEGNYHNIQCWSPNGRYTCYTHWGGDDGPGGKGSAEVHVVDLKTGEDRRVDKGINPRWARRHNWLFYCHYTGDEREWGGHEVKRSDLGTFFAAFPVRCRVFRVVQTGWAVFCTLNRCHDESNGCSAV